MKNFFGLCCLIVFMLASCASPPDIGDNVSDEILLETPADSMAMDMVMAMGGLDVWNNIRFVRFDFGTESQNGRNPSRRHLWDKFDGRYRLEYQVGSDTVITVLFNTVDTLGRAFINGNEVGANEKDELVRRGHQRYINDTYWLIAPFKVFDDGVNRSIEMINGMDKPALSLSFNSVGYTPGDRYWLSVSETDGRVATWTYLLQGRTSSSSYEWIDYQGIPSPAGTLHLSTTKASPLFSIHTDNISFPESVGQEMFESGEALLK